MTDSVSSSAEYGLSEEYYGSRLTTMTFDRTKEQRAARTAAIIELRDNGISGEQVEIMANKRMFDDFMHAVAGMVDSEREQIQYETAEQERDDITPEQIEGWAKAEVKHSLMQCNEYLPLPELDGFTKVGVVND